MYCTLSVIFCRLVKQIVSSGVTVLGGVSFKAHSPPVIEALRQCLCSHGLALPCGSITTVYRVAIQGNVYYGKSYERVKKRNSYTIVYLSNGIKQYVHRLLCVCSRKGLCNFKTFKRPTCYLWITFQHCNTCFICACRERRFSWSMFCWLYFR